MTEEFKYRNPDSEGAAKATEQAALRAILHRVKHRPAWFKNPAVSDKDWWVTQFTYEQMEGNRKAIIELCERELGSGT